MAKSVQQRQHRERILVAAIDFGTTFSGYAFSFRHDFDKDPLKIHANQWGSGSRNVSLKTPSCILFNPDKTFHSFGSDAEDKYSELALDGLHGEWYYYRRFKMRLYHTEGVNRDVNLSDESGKSMPAMTVFSSAIRFLKDHMIMTCEKRNYGLTADDIQWVLTVPAIWDDVAKQFMREAAVHAGIESGNLSIALEPEAASLYCKYLPVERISSSGRGAITCFQPKSRYLVLDAGGGTIDITVHEVQADGTLRELHKANGGAWGGTKVDESFLEFLKNIAGPDVMEIFFNNHRDDYLDLFREFELKKRTITPDIDQKITFKIPISLHEAFREMNGGQDFRVRLMDRKDLKDSITFAGDKMRAQAETVKGFFKETCDTIAAHLHKILSEPASAGVETILMVGGFSESPVLRDAVERSFQNMRVIVPNEAGLAVLNGAVIFGHNPRTISSRVCKYTYGIKMYGTFIPGIHPESKKIIESDGSTLCRGCFDKHAEINQEIQVGTAVKETIYYPSSVNGSHMKLAVYVSKKKDPLLVDEEGCVKLGQLDVELDCAQYGSDKPVQVRLIFGGTELDVEAIEQRTGKKTSATFDFLE